MYIFPGKNPSSQNQKQQSCRRLGFCFFLEWSGNQENHGTQWIHRISFQTNTFCLKSFYICSGKQISFVEACWNYGVCKQNAFFMISIIPRISGPFPFKKQTRPAGGLAFFWGDIGNSKIMKIKESNLFPQERHTCSLKALYSHRGTILVGRSWPKSLHVLLGSIHVIEAVREHSRRHSKQCLYDWNITQMHFDACVQLNVFLGETKWKYNSSRMGQEMLKSNIC